MRTYTVDMTVEYNDEFEFNTRRTVDAQNALAALRRADDLVRLDAYNDRSVKSVEIVSADVRRIFKPVGAV